jgi:hypothetical protein
MERRRVEIKYQIAWILIARLYGGGTYQPPLSTYRQPDTIWQSPNRVLREQMVGTVSSERVLASNSFVQRSFRFHTANGFDSTIVSNR